MIATETVTINEQQFVHTYSTSGRFVVRDGIAYNEAYDPAELAPNRIYTEGDEIDPEASEADYAQVGRILMGVE